MVKLQVITLAAKLLVLAPTDRTLGLLARYAFSLARYDLNYDVRDRARMLHALLSGIVPSLRLEGTNGSEDGADEDQEDAHGARGGVVLRREQIRVVLFEGKAGVVESDGGPGKPDAPPSLHSGANGSLPWDTMLILVVYR